MLQSQTPELSRNAIKWLCELITVRDERILTLGSRTVRAKVAATFVSLAKKFGKVNADGSIKIIPSIDRRTLSELSGTVTETFSRTVTDLEDRKIIARDRRAIRILDMEALQECVEE